MTINILALRGLATVSLWRPDGSLKSRQTIQNLITNAGDSYYATRGAAAVVPAAPADATKVTTMKLGTGATSAHKSSATGATIGAGTYITGSNNAFDATYPVVTAVGSDVGYQIEYRTTWAAGDSTNAAITEAIICTDSDDGASTVAETISRITFTAIDKQANDILIISWFHKFLGA